MANEFKVKKGLIVDGSGTVVDIQGTEGQLFSVTDSLTGDLFSVSDVSGVPILNINSSGTVEVDGTLNVNSSSTLVIDGTVDSNIVMPTAGDQIRIGTFTDGSSNSGEYANDDIVIGDGGSITIFPHRRGDYGLNETGNTSTTFRSKLNIWSDNQDHITFGGAHTKIRTAWEHFHLWINNDSADAGFFRLYNKSSEVEFARLAGEGSSFILENFRVKQTADTGFNSGLTVERSANTQKVHIGMDGGAVNFNSPDGLSYKFRNNGTETFTLNGSGYGIISNRLQVGKAGGASNSGRLDLFGRYSSGTTQPTIFFKTDHPSNSTQWDMAQINAADGGNYNGQLYFKVASGSGSAGNAASLATALFIDDTKDATFYGNITSSGSLILGAPSNGNAVNKLTIASGTNGDGIFLTGLGTSAGMGTGNYRAIDFQYSNTDASFQSAIRFVVPDSTIHGGQMEFWTDNSSGTNTKALTLDKLQNATLAGNVFKIEGASPYIRGTGSGAMRIKHTSGETMYLRPDETGALSIFEGANSQTVFMMTVAPSTNNTQNNSAKLAFQTRSKQSDGQNNSKTAYIQHETYDIGNNYGNLEFSGTNKATFSGMDVIITDNKALMLGTGGDAFIKHTGSHFNIYNDTGAMNFIQRVDDGNIVFTCDDGAGGTFDYFSVDGGSTTHDGTSTTAAYTKWQDKSRIALGSGKDLQLYHDGSNSYIETDTGSAGDLYIKAQGTNHDLYLQAVDDIFIRPQGGENGIYVQGNGGVSLYHDNTVRISTADFGATVNGTGEFGTGTYRTYVYGSAAGSFITFGTTSDNDSLGSMGTYGSAMMFETNQGLGFIWKHGGNEKMRLNTSGHLGILTNAPRYQLDLAKVDNASQTDYLALGVNNGPSTGDGTSLGTGIVWKANYSGYSKRSAGIMQTAEGNYFRSGLAFFTNNQQSTSSDWVERMRLNMDGKLTLDPGVGVASGGTVFDVQGSEGQLFSVTNSLSGDLFSVSDVSGIPILNVNSSGAVDIDGEINLDGDINLDYGDKINFGTSGSGLEIYADSGSNSYIKETGGSGALVFQSNGYYFQDNSNNTRVYINGANGDTTVGGKLIVNGGPSDFAGAVVIQGDATVHTGLYPDTNYGAELGTTSLRFSNIRGRYCDLQQSSTSNPVLRLTDEGVASYDFTFPSTSEIRLSTGTTSTKTFKITNTGSGSFNLDVEGSVTASSFSGDGSGLTGVGAPSNMVTTNTAQTISGNKTFSGTTHCSGKLELGFAVNSKGGQWEIPSTSLQTYRCDSDRLRIYMGSERLTITDSGRVGINKYNPAYTLDVNGSVSNVSIYASHDVAAYSDARVKTDIETIPNALEKVNKLRGVTFKRTDEGTTDKRMMGVIAQEVLDVIPEVVNKRESDGHYSVSYGNIVGVLIEAIKELKAEIEECKSNKCNCK